jgi:hypothetical protein
MGGSNESMVFKMFHLNNIFSIVSFYIWCHIACTFSLVSFYVLCIESKPSRTPKKGYKKLLGSFLFCSVQNKIVFRILCVCPASVEAIFLTVRVNTLTPGNHHSNAHSKHSVDLFTQQDQHFNCNKLHNNGRSK